MKLRFSLIRFQHYFVLSCRIVNIFRVKMGLYENVVRRNGCAQVKMTKPRKLFAYASFETRWGVDNHTIINTLFSWGGFPKKLISISFEQLSGEHGHRHKTMNCGAGSE